MLTRLPSVTLFRIWAALMLAAIGLQATEPFTAPLQYTHGSAFSAATYETAVAPPRKNESIVAFKALQPLGPPPTAALLARARPSLPQVMSALAPDSTGPPSRDIHSWGPAARAPPRA